MVSTGLWSDHLATKPCLYTLFSGYYGNIQFPRNPVFGSNHGEISAFPMDTHFYWCVFQKRKNKISVCSAIGAQTQGFHSIGAFSQNGKINFPTCILLVRFFNI
jgi:hypothetical protein